ncbi:hypothetical protein GOBAR_AA09914 [Gossypium barbadense]|uniref:Uncharacterized protein n=1 Tax=Gossypium barbadense TaxID=3634 RepID=A0A2P5Y597_GOSBA|nr:hypothetical protein GOBAR_AA09914 [Gossypium barbadense]
MLSMLEMPYGDIWPMREVAPGAKVCQHFEGEKCMCRLRACSSFSSLNSSIYKPSAAPNSGTLSWQTNPPRYVGSIIPKNSSSGSVYTRACGFTQLCRTTVSSFIRFSHARVYKPHTCLNLTARVEEILALFSHGLKHARVLGRVSVKTPDFKISISAVYLKSAELGMTHLHRTEWKNTEYRKRDFLIWCGSDNVGIYGI